MVGDEMAMYKTKGTELLPDYNLVRQYATGKDSNIDLLFLKDTLLTNDSRYMDVVKRANKFNYMDDTTVEGIRNKAQVLIGTMYIIDYNNKLGHATIPPQAKRWCDLLMDKYIDDFCNDKEMFEYLKTNNLLIMFPALVYPTVFFDWSEKSNAMDSADDTLPFPRYQTFSSLIEASLEEEEDFTVLVILSLIFGFKFNPINIKEQLGIHQTYNFFNV